MNVHPTGGTVPVRRVELPAGRDPADTVQRALRDLEAARHGLAGEAALCTRSAIEELRSALAALRDNGDLAGESSAAALRADLQTSQEQHGPATSNGSPAA